MHFIGITGGVGAGKTEILQYIRQHYKCEIYLADEVAHQVKRAGTACFARLVELLGEEIVSADGEIDKAVMADRIFSDAGLLEKVNAIVHPAVIADIKKWSVAMGSLWMKCGIFMPMKRCAECG